MTEENTTQQAAFSAWIAELPARQKLMTPNELYQMVCDKVGKADRETMAEWLRQLGDKLGMASTPWIDHKWWQPSGDLSVYASDGWMVLNNDGTHKWRYITKIQGETEWAFVLRTMDETAELWLQSWQDDMPSGWLQLRTPTSVATLNLSEDDCRVLSSSVRELMTRHSEGISEAQERSITQLGKYPQTFKGTEQIFTSPKVFSHESDDTPMPLDTPPCKSQD